MFAQQASAQGRHFPGAWRHEGCGVQGGCERRRGGCGEVGIGVVSIIGE